MSQDAGVFRSPPLLVLAWLVPPSVLLAGCAVKSVPHQPRTNPSEAVAVYHVLERGQTLYSVSRAYGVPLQTLMRANGITDPTSIPAGTPLFVPGATRRLSLPSPAIPALSWPLRGRITSDFGRRGNRSYHEGVDIDGDRGDHVAAAADGTVVQAGAGHRYGRFIVIDHGQGVTTLYAHASRLFVKAGDRVERGDPIAEVGHSGNARGTHLHFEVRLNGRVVDPLSFLSDQVVTAAPAR